MFTSNVKSVRVRLPELGGVLATVLLANTALSLSYASLIEALEDSAGASTRTALLLNMWAFALVFCSHRYPIVLRRCGAKICAAISLLLSACAISILALSHAFPMWLGAEALQGVAFGLFYVVAETWLNSSFEEVIRNRINALYLAVQSLGFAAGPVIVSLGKYSISTCFAIAATMMGAAALAAWLLVPDNRDCDAKQSAVGLRHFIQISRQLPWVVMLGLMTGALDNSAWSLLTPYLRSAGYSDSMSLLALSVFVWGQVVLLMPLGYYADKAGEQRLMKLVAGFIVIYCVVLTQARQLPQILVLALTFAFGPACFSIYGAALSLAGKQVQRDQLAVASASLVTGWCLGGFAGAILIGLAMDLWNARAFPATLLVIAMAIVAVVAWVVPSSARTRKYGESPTLGSQAKAVSSR